MPAFDSHRPPEPDVIADCVHCGFCLDACPTYVLWAEEADSPRGRIVLISEGVSAAEESISEEMVTHFDRCLGCMACVTACPSGVRYDRLIERVRPQVERHYRRPRAERALRRVLFETLPHPGRMRVLVPLIAAGRRLPLDGLPGPAAALAKIAPRTSARAALTSRLPERIPAAGEPRGTGRAAAGLRAARLLSPHSRGDGPHPRRRGLRGDHPPHAPLLRRAPVPLR